MLLWLTEDKKTTSNEAHYLLIADKSQPEDGSYLCPNDLILGRSTSTIPQAEFDHGTDLSRRFRFIQSLTNAFWRKWTRDFFPSLIVRSKWHVERRNIQIGDVVLLKDANALRGSWRLARVMDTKPVRCKQMNKTNSAKTTDLERPAHNVIVIVPADEEDEEDQGTFPETCTADGGRPSQNQAEGLPEGE